MSKPPDLDIAAAAPGSRLARIGEAVRRAAMRFLPDKLVRLMFSAQVVAVLDQIVVSGTSFVATVLIGRSAGSAELGAYAVMLSVVATTLAVQNALVLLPYTIRQYRTGISAEGHAGSSLALSGLLSVLVAVGVLIVAGSFAVGGASSALISITWALAPVLPFALMREFARRFAFARLRMSSALAIDMAVAAIQLTLLGSLAWIGAMTALTASFALGLACALPAFAWLYRGRADFSVRVPELRDTAVRSWELGKWLVLSQVTTQAQSYAVYWVSIIIAGAAVTGVFAAAMSIVAFANPLIFGIANVLTPKLALAWKQGGRSGLRKEALLNASLMGGVMTAFCLVVALFGEEALRILFHSQEYRGHGNIVTILAFAAFATAIGMPASNGLAQMERPRAVVVVTVFGATVTIVLVTLLILKWGLLGAAYGSLAGGLVGAAARWTAFLSIAHRTEEPAAADDVVRRLAGADADRVVTRLGEGDYASVYSVAAQNAPLQEVIVAKLYKAGGDPGMAQAEFVGLERLHQALHGRIFRGWTVYVPWPITLSPSPLAMTMTGIPGQHLAAHAAGGRLSPEIIEAASAAFAMAMQHAWAQGVIHGDLGLRNVLFDLDARTMALVDPGTLESCGVCNASRQARAALDLGHLLAELVTDVDDLIGNPEGRLHKQNFVTGVLRAVLAGAASHSEREHMLSDVRQSVAAHLASTLTPSFSPRGIWHAMIKAIAERRIADIFARLERDLDAGLTRMPRG